MQRQGGKICPSFLLVAKGPVVRGGFVWGVGVYPGRRLPGSWPRGSFCSGYSDYCPLSTLYFRGPELCHIGGPWLWCLLLTLVPHWHRRCQLPFSKSSPSARNLPGHRGGDKSPPFGLCLCRRKPKLGACSMWVPVGSAPRGHQMGSLRSIAGCKLPWTNQLKKKNFFFLPPSNPEIKWVEYTLWVLLP